MNDDVKAAADAALVESMVRQLRDCVSVGDEMTLDHATLLDDAADWIAGEAARTAAAVAAAREEQRAEDMLSLGREEQSSWAAFRIKAAPLTATPLADELRDEREVSQSLREQLIAAEAERDALRAQLAAETNLYRASMTEASRAIEGLTAQVEAVEAERDALRAQVAEAVERLDEFGSQATLADGIQAMRLRLVKLRAQVEAARAKTKEEEARRVELLLLTPCASEDYKEGVRQAAAKIRSERTFTTLDAMDGAKP